MSFTLEYIAKSCGGVLSDTSNPQRTISAFFTDSRTPDKNKLFLGIRGERVDGNDFIPQLLKDGYCAMTDRSEHLTLNGDCIYVEDVRDALQRVAMYFRENELSHIPFVGITGSVGKTTTKEMVYCALSSALNVYKTEGNFNSQIGLPQTVLKCEPTSQCAIVELGMSMPGEMEKISRCARPDISIVTNIGYSHIENLGSREAIRDEKLKIAMFSGKDSVLLLNGDEPLLRDVDTNGKKAYYISVADSSCDCYSSSIEDDGSKLSFIACIFGKQYEVKLNVRGKHFVINALFALATAALMNIDVSLAVKSLSAYESDGKRQFVFEQNGHTVISDCYNAAPESMKAALCVLKASKGRRVAVLGDMLELGAESIRLHKEVGYYVSECADVLITYGTLAKNIAEVSTVKEKYSFANGDSAKLKEFLEKYIKNGDTVLYKASNGMKLGTVIV